MTRYLITSPAYTGTAELHYNSLGTLVLICTQHTNMGVAQMHKWKLLVPAAEGELTNVFAPTQCTVIQADLVVTFDMFWNGYNNKVSKIKAHSIWNKLKKEEQVLAYYGIKPYDKFLRKTDWRGKADPDTYLRNKYWLNEYR